ncbi:anti-sigma factor [Asinibacterium sp. OR53]|uniref:anti-sigma factor family protein n=1 Tax=Asinibacterium sp. OR53 TaxID=925409 RepID=UPI00047C8101|nr:hypothetical protein [Asinibacterium sp. OR53]
MINIDRHNYEELFLLYLDGELPAADAKAVEQFVADNPDLAVELEALRQTLLLPGEPVDFPFKESLYKNTTSVNASSYEEQLLSYIDDELAGAEKESMEALLMKNPEAKAYLHLLQQTKLEAEPVSFPYKESLYRSASTKRPVIYISWQRVAVAAVLAGLGLVIWLIPGSLRRNLPAEKELAAINKPTVQPQNKTTIPSPGTVEHVITNTENKELVAVHTTTPAANKQPTIKIQTAGAIPVENSLPAEQNRSLAKVQEAIPVSTNVGRTEIHQPVEVLAANTSLQQPVIAPKEATAANNNAAITKYKELETDEDNKGLLLGSIEINKDKLRGFFRKASSIFKSKAAREEEDNRSLR